MVPSIFFKSLQLSRSALYFAESLPLGVMARLITGTSRKEFEDPQKLKHLIDRIDRLLEQDSKHFAQGDFPLKLLKPGSPLKHYQSLVDVLIDSYFVARRMKENKTKDFSKKHEPHVSESPDYFQRNFHFQSGGYFSRSSARRYDHQVDILFSGTTDAMRRQAFVPILNRKDKSFKTLEIACGQGGATRQFAAIFPKAQVVATDLSQAYLSVAKERLREFSQVDFVKMDGANLSFKDDEFDVVYHVYLFHELPLKVRKEVMKECYRVLKPGGRLIVADSLQLGDDPETDWALTEFPKRYHEPFYTNYIKSSLEDLFKDSGFELVESSHQFMTKSVTALKPQAPH